MAGIQPVPKGTELLQRVIDLAQAREKDKWAISAIRKEAEALKKNDAYRAYVILGELEFVLGNFSVAEEQYRRAFRLCDTDPVSLINYANSLRHSGFLHRSIAAYKKAVQVRRDIESLRGLVDALMLGCFFTEASERIEVLRKMEPNQLKHVELAATIRRLADTLNNSEISESDAGQVSTAIFSVLNGQKITPNQHSLSVTTDNRIALTVFVPLEPRDVVELNFLLADALAQSDLPRNVTSTIVAGFLPDEG